MIIGVGRPLMWIFWGFFLLFSQAEPVIKTPSPALDTQKQINETPPAMAAAARPDSADSVSKSETHSYVYPTFYAQCAAKLNSQMEEKIQSKMSEFDETSQLKGKIHRKDSVYYSYLKDVILEACVIEQIKEVFQKKPHNLCAQSQPSVECILMHLKGKIKTSSGLSFATMLITFAGQNDKKRFPDLTVRNLMIVDKSLQLMMDTSLDTFTLYQRESHPDETTQITAIRLEDSKILKAQAIKMATLAEDTVQKTKTPKTEVDPAYKTWKESISHVILNRCRELRSKNWSYQ
jgi:hypothetical protein